MLKKQKNNLDEMQEQKLLKIEHNAIWFAFWALLAAIIIQIIMGGDHVTRSIAGEWIVFMCLAVYLLSASIKNGIWDRKRKPNLKNHILLSLATGLATGSLFTVTTYVKYPGKLLGSIATGAFIFMPTFILTLAALSAASAAYKKQVRKLETIDDEQ